MKKILQHLFEHKTLSKEQAAEVMHAMSRGEYNEHELTAFMTVFLMRSITMQELQGFRQALLELCVPISFSQQEVLDIVGTGGDGKNTFNISTAACFVAAGAGHSIAKHGNYGASSISGSSNVMESLGYQFSNDNKKLQTELNEAGICFMHAPFFHPALKAVAPIRRNLGVRTFFNMLGPLVNPAQPSTQLIGVFSLEMARIYNYLLQQSQNTFTIIHSLDGYDEISLTSDVRVMSEKGDALYTPDQLGKRMVMATDIEGGNSVEEAAQIFKRIISGNGSWPQTAVVLANAAMAMFATGHYKQYDDAYQAAVDSLENGKAANALTKLIALQAA